MQRTLSTSPKPAPRVEHSALRFRHIVDLETGDIVSSLAETSVRFAERAVFGPAALTTTVLDNPAKWLASHMEDAAAAADLCEMHARPILLRAPVAAFAHSNTAIACDAAATRTKMLPQEFSVEFADGALAASPKDAADRVRSLRRRGFRVSIDATKAWNTPFDAGMRLMLDTIRVDADKLYANADLQDRCDAAFHAGITIIAERARWRDVELLAGYGVRCAIDPRADA